LQIAKKANCVKRPKYLTKKVPIICNIHIPYIIIYRVACDVYLLHTIVKNNIGWLVLAHNNM